MSNGFRVVAAPTESAPKKKSGKFRKAHTPRTAVVVSSGQATVSGGVPLAEFARGLASSHGADPSLALRCEIIRCDAVRALCLDMDRVVLGTYGCDPKGLFTAFVFESMNDDGVVIGPRDALLPCHPRPKSVHDRLTGPLHDKRTMTQAQCDDTAWRIAEEVGALAIAHRERLAAALAAAMLDTVILAPPVVVTGDEMGVVAVSAGPYRHEVLAEHWAKLRALHNEEESCFPQRAFTMLTRYYGLTGASGPDVAQRESGWHGSVPGAVLDAMGQHLGVSAECFASPLNATMASYFSAFPDTDAYFGSCGSFFSVVPSSGSYEANPPFDVTIAVKMAQVMCDALVAASSPLSFVVVMPYSDKGKCLPSTEAVMAVFRTHSTFLRVEHTVPAAEAPYVDGYQQCQADAFFLTHLDTRVFLLQNAAAVLMHPSKEAVAAVAAVWASEAPPAKRPRDTE